MGLRQGGTGGPRTGRAPTGDGTEPDGAAPVEVARVHPLPDGPEGGDGLTQRQRLVLETIQEAVERRGYPPSLREIGEAVGLTSPSSVAHQLTSLERKGYLRRDPNRPRAIEVTVPTANRGRPEPSGTALTAIGAPGSAPGTEPLKRPMLS